MGSPHAHRCGLRARIHLRVARLGRRLILIGLLLTLTGVLTLLTGVALTLPVFVIGLGLGTCFGTVYQITLGDVDPTESGSASGSPSATQQLANSIGAAALTTVYFHSGPTVSLGVVAALLLSCCALVRLLPRHAQPRH
ncbi:hypothetical protein [Nonomuraea jabiensis]|uniref:hypothetical protein n=1 Tax=Nonomuraea jabiensis TaxID=882448 RepID=UPI003D709C89